MIVRSKANEILASLFPNNTQTGKYTYIGLSTTTPTETGANFTEPASSTGYKRMKLDKMGTPADGQVENTDIIFFPESVASWGTITHFGLFSAQSSGTPYLWGALNSSVAVATGYIPIFRANALIVGLDKDPLTLPS